jgi:hypothetical protein
MRTSSPQLTEDNIRQLLDRVFEKLPTYDRYRSYLVEPYSILKRTSEIAPPPPKDLPQVNLSIKNKALLRLYERSLGMFQAGSDREELFDTIYAFPKIPPACRYLLDVEDPLDVDEDFIPANLSPKYIETWMRCLCGTAKAVRKSTESIQASNVSRFFILGDIGSGKTTFLNYAFSKYNIWMRNNGIVWIRLDLTKAHYRAMKVMDAITQQTVKVFRGFYHDELWDSRKGDILPEIERRFRLSVTSHDQTVINKHIEDYLQPYDPERIEPYHDCIQAGIKTWLQNHYAMIYVIDGLDKMGSETEFKEKIEEVQQGILGTEKTQHLYVIVMRNRSHVDLLKSYIDHAEHAELSALRREAKTFVVLPPKMQEIVDNRLNYLNRKWQALVEEEQDKILYDEIAPQSAETNKMEDILRAISWIAPNSLKAHHHVFLVYLYRALSFKDLHDSIRSWTAPATYSALKNLAGSNFRILLHIMNLSHKRFLQTIQQLNLTPNDLIEIDIHLENRTITDSSSNANSHLSDILKKHYRVIETLIRNSSSGRRPSDYIYDDDQIVRLPSSSSDSKTYVPNIFRVANVPNVPSERSYLLSKIRILQLLQLDGESTKEEILHSLHEQFYYPKDRSLLNLNDLEHDSLVAQSAKWPEGAARPVIVYSNTRVGRSMLNNLVIHFNYLANVSEDILVPKDVVHAFARKKSISPYEDWVMWNFSQIPQALAMICLISALERIEKERYEPLFGSMPAYEITENIINNVKPVIQKIMQSAVGSSKQTHELLDLIGQSDIVKSVLEEKT